MKELSIEEKAKAYDEALELARVAAFNGHQSLMEGIFPELQESNDEKTRKRIIALVNAHGQGMYKDDMLTWLENIPYTIDHEKREGFHLGYKAGLEKQGNPNKEYWRGYREGKQEVLDKYAELEKQGEQKPTIEMKSAEESLGISSEKYNDIVNECLYGESKAEWKQENVEELSEFENAMMHIGYSFFGKRGGLDPNDTSSVKVQAQYLLELAQKPAWSEKNEKEYKYVLKFVDNILNNCGNKKDYDHCKRCYDWLKSIKQKIGG